MPRMKKKVKKPTAVDILICSLSKKTIGPPRKQEHKSRLILIVLDCGTFLPFMTILLLSYSFFLFPNFLSFPLHWPKKSEALSCRLSQLLQGDLSALSANIKLEKDSKKSQ